MKNFFGENAEFFTQKPEKHWADNSFRKSINPHCSSGIEKSSFDNSAGKDSPGVWRLTIFCETSQKMSITPFFEQSVPKKRSSSSVECLFYSLGKNMLLSGRKFFAECPKKIKIRIGPSQQFPSELNPKTVRKHDFYYPNGRFLKFQKKVNNQKFLESICSTESYSEKKAVLTSPPENFQYHARTIVHNVWKYLQNYLFFSIKIVP